ncbi:MAG: cytochrome C oxidase Cbb3 [Sphingomonadales bacterium BRH_c42]|nr:MAG: cytochrome C oxidase Cbb3 [Sphingomonadales bacterium BRH_c42]
MTVYETLRHFADSYGLAILFAVFVILCAWPFRPGSKGHNQAAANSIFKDDHDGQ